MKIAFLITAHNQPGHLHRLVRALETEDSSFYIHVDKKSNLSEFTKFGYSNHVHFLSERFEVHHAGFALVNAMINLLKIALENKDPQYFMFLSGWDYPIKDNCTILETLAQNYPTNYINFYPLVGRAALIKNIQKYYLIDWAGSVRGLLAKPAKALGYIIKNIPLNRRFIPGLVPYRGSAWFCLNRSTVEYMLNYLQTREGKALYNFMKTTSCADEMIFHTIVLNSPFANQCRFYERDILNNQNPLQNENKAYLHYIDWDPNRENPAQFVMDDFEKLAGSEALFARKFNEIKSKRVLDAIDQYILNKNREAPDQREAVYFPKLSDLCADQIASLEVQTL